MESTRNLWQEVVRRAVMDVKGKGPISHHTYNGKRGAKYRKLYRDIYRDRALRFLGGEGNWELCCHCLDREPEDYSKEIMGGINGNRRTLKRDAKKGRKRVQVATATDLAARAMRGAYQEGSAAGMENRAI